MEAYLFFVRCVLLLFAATVVASICLVVYHQVRDHLKLLRSWRQDRRK